MLGVGIQQICVGVVACNRGINVGKQDHEQQETQGDDVHLFPEEHPKHGLPIGIPGRSDLFGLRVGMGYGSKQLFVGILIQIFMHIAHLPLEVKEILGSTREMRISPRMLEITVSTA